MRPSLTRRRLLATSALLGTGALAGCQGLTDAVGPETDSGGTDSLGLAYSESQGPYPSDDPVHSGWVHIVSDGESADLTFDARLCSGLGAVDPELTAGLGDEYVLRFAVSGEYEGLPDGSTPDTAQCESVTRLVGGANVPRDWEQLTVTVDGVEVQTVERSGTMPTLRPLPDPIGSR